MQLRNGRVADVAVLKLEGIEMQLEDTHAQLRPIRELLVPKAVWREGQPGTITKPRTFPNLEAIEVRKPWRERLVVRDDLLEVASQAAR